MNRLHGNAIGFKIARRDASIMSLQDAETREKHEGFKWSTTSKTDIRFNLEGKMADLPGFNERAYMMDSPIFFIKEAEDAISETERALGIKRPADLQISETLCLDPSRWHEMSYHRGN